MIIILPKKFADKDLDEFIDSIYKNFSFNKTDDYTFDFSNVEFIGNQELLVLSALFKSFYNSKIKFKVIFFKEGISTNDINIRVKRQIIQIWNVWKIYKIVPPNLIKDFFGIDGNSVQRIQEQLNYFPKQYEIYDRHGITPFLSLNFINNYNENDIKDSIDQIYKLNSVIVDLLSKNNCYHPFTSNSLSTIITEELYLNFLEHSLGTSFPRFEQMAFMSISFQSKLDEMKNSEEEIQRIKKWNFQTECLPEAEGFHFHKLTNKYHNRPYIQFSFLDFGFGIVNTLREEFLKQNSSELQKSDSDILKFAFNYNSSRHPIFIEKNKLEQFIPRGLFDILSIVRRYNGLLISRSNFGKILFDFSDEKNIDKAAIEFGSSKFYFPGTLISIYIPAILDNKKINISSIKPEVIFAKIKPQNKKYLSINSLIKTLDNSKDIVYSTLLKKIKDKICEENEHSLVFISFKGCKLDKRIIKKTIYFLLTDYDINHKNNVVILNTPPDNLANEIADEILILNEALKNYKIHPLPIIDFDENNKNLNVKWLGIYDVNDKEKLKNLLFEQYSLSKSDFIDPANIIGQLNEFDSYGNLISNFPNYNDIVKFFKQEAEINISEQVKGLLTHYDCIKKDDGINIYLCNGNYYQKEYIELSNLLNDKADCGTVSELLFQKLDLHVQDLSEYEFIGITTTSQKLLKSLESKGLIKSDQYDSTIDNFHSFEKNLTEEKIKKNKNYILICDVISTGYLTVRLNTKLKKFNSHIQYVAVVASILDVNFRTSKDFLKDFDSKIISLITYPILKYERKELGSELFTKNIVRINPFTNIPIRLSIEETNFDESISFSTSLKYIEVQNDIIIYNEFLDNINENTINIGYLKYNNVIHPYFFDTKYILKNIDENLLTKIFEKINNQSFNKEKIKVFFPRKSGIDEFNFKLLEKVLNNQHLEVIEIERFGTNEGWRFPHNTDYFNSRIMDSFCFILDDGSCSGDSLIQMIDEISFYDAKEIAVLCFIGRVNDHKREFFSRISNIKVKNGRIIPISIYFVCHWHIPTYYIEDNPNTQETNWLQHLINLQNTPRVLKKIASSILIQITPKEEISLSNYKYLPKRKEDNEIPKKEMLSVREELGKVIGFRLYKESYIYFNFFIRKYQRPKLRKDHFKDIELLCATFIYEPYLYENMHNSLPDITERIENFVYDLIFEKQKKIYEQLNYNWEEKDILHLFFIVFKNEKLIKILSNKENLKKIIEFNPKEKPNPKFYYNINYILYNFLKYIPIATHEFDNKEYDHEIRKLIQLLITDEEIKYKEVKRYFNFINTLPSRDDFDSQLEFIVENYNKQETPEYHLEKKSFDHNISNIISGIRYCIFQAENNMNLDKKQIDSIREKWFGILDFINPILRFASSFPEYLIPFPYFNLISSIENGENSVRGIVGFTERVIFSLTQQYSDKEKLYQLEKNIINIQLILQNDSNFNRLIKNRKSQFNELLRNIYEDLELANIKVNILNKDFLNNPHSIMIPSFYANELIRKEIVTNIKNHSLIDNETCVEISILSSEDSNLIMNIKNKKSPKEYNKSNLEGIKCLYLLAASPLFKFNYQHDLINDFFLQKLTFKLF